MESEDNHETWAEIGRQREAQREVNRRRRWTVLVVCIAGAGVLYCVLTLIYDR